MIGFLLDALVTVPAFLAVLTVVVVVHELGHFWAARVNGVAVDAFSLGWGKAILELRDKHGIRWKLARWPIGGFVKFKGDDNAASMPMTASYEDPAERADARKAGILQAMPVGVRAFVSVAGPLANFIFAILTFALIFMVVGRPAQNVAPIIVQVEQGSAADQAGLRAKDRIVAIDGTAIQTFAAMQRIVRASPNQPLQFRVQGDGGSDRTLTVTPKPRQELSQTGRSITVGTLGVRSASHLERLGPIAALGAGMQRTGEMIANQIGFLQNLVVGRASTSNLSGPIGIANLSGQVAKGVAVGVAADGGDGWRVAASVGLTLLELSAFLSVAIGFINLLPVPILDGGALAFYAVEAIRGKALGPRAQAIGYNVGLLFVGLLFLVATWNDVLRVVNRS